MKNDCTKPLHSPFFIMILFTYLVLVVVNGFVIPFHEKKKKSVLKSVHNEYFSIAPMMGHTNRHYHAYIHDMLFSHIQDVIHLYTEMIPASTVVRLASESPEYGGGNRPEATLELQQLLQKSNSAQVTLQLGGRNGAVVAEASYIAYTHFGYTSINLNCGCPSLPVTTNAHRGATTNNCGGAVLMKDAAHVVDMIQQIAAVIPPQHVDLSIKHRLGIRFDIDTYRPPSNSLEDKKEEEEAYESCLEFAHAIASTKAIQRLQIHARLALLAQSETPTATVQSGKVDHSRVQYREKQKARLATITNRSAPPLRPTIVERVASSLEGQVQVITNGGIQTTRQSYQRLENDQISGVMVGRAVINHPCSFTNLEPNKLITLSSNSHEIVPTTTTTTTTTMKNIPTRGQVIQDYINYCKKQEEGEFYKNHKNREELAKKLVAVPFSLFVGKEGNDAYQRTIRKLVQKKISTMSTEGILQAALQHIPDDVLFNQLVTDTTTTNTENKNDKYSLGTKRSGPLQRMIW